MLLHGVLPPITTPFYQNGDIYFRKLQHNVEKLCLTPVSGLVVLGSTGEAVMLSDAERRDVLKCAMEFAAPEKVMVAGTAAESARETLVLTEYAATLGYDVALVRTPHYYKGQMKPQNMLAYYRTVADRSPLPIVIYNFPPATGYDIPADVVIELAEHTNIMGIKESSGSTEKVQLMVEKTRHIAGTAVITSAGAPVTVRMKNAPGEQKNVGFQVLVGTAQKLLALLDVGAVGGILAFANAAPIACHEIWAAHAAGNHKLAAEKQQHIVKAATRVSAEMSIPGTKYAMDLNGYYGGNGRVPLLPLTAEMKREVEELMENIKA